MKTGKFVDLIKKGETEKIEFKSQISKKIGEEICALQNTHGGYIFIGVTDEGKIIGCNLKRSKEKVSQHLNNITPPTKVKFHQIEIDSKQVLGVEVSSSDQLCAIGGNVYIRAGTSKRPLSLQEIMTQAAETLLFEMDRTPIPGEKVNQQLVEQFLSKARIDVYKPKKYLEQIGVETKEGTLTLAGFLFFTETPQSKLPHTSIRLLYKDGSWKRITGPLSKMIKEIEKEFEDLFRQVSVQPGFKRIDIQEYPMKAVREGVVNALVHRNYAIKSEIFIVFDEKGLKIKNPGSFPPGSTPSNPQPVPRNPILYELMFQSGYVERQGRGIELIYDECRKHPFVSAEYNMQDNFTTLIFHKQKKSLTDKEKEILSILAKGEKTASELSKDLDVSKPTVLKSIENLLEIGFVKKMGKGPSTRYKISNSLK